MNGLGKSTGFPNEKAGCVVTSSTAIPARRCENSRLPSRDHTVWMPRGSWYFDLVAGKGWTYTCGILVDADSFESYATKRPSGENAALSMVPDDRTSPNGSIFLSAA